MSAWAMSGIVQRFGGWPFGAARSVLHGVSFEIARGERVALIGPSGSGKTTLVRAGLGLIVPNAGSIELLGSSTRGWSARRWHEARRAVQILFQSPRAMLHPDLPLGLLLEESARLHRPGELSQVVAREVASAVGLEDRLDALPRSLSGGERRRAGIARVLVARPQLLVADEPTSGLDAVSRNRMMQLLVDTVGTGCALVLVTHDLASVVAYTDRCVVMHEGQVVETFESRAVGGRFVPAHPVTRELLSSARRVSG